jgi:thiol-disulfide isomerase/thioredoxin
MGQDHLVGRIPLGVHAFHGDGQLIALGRTKGDSPYDLLFIDADLDDDLADEKPVAARPGVIRDKWWSSFDGELKAIHTEGPDGAIAYPVSMWVTVETPEETPSLIRYSRRGFSVANLIIEGTEYTVLVSDGNNDGVIGKGDFWRIDGSNPQASADWSRMPDHCWAEGKAWKLTMEGTDGRSGTLNNFDAGRTQADDDAARDPYRADKDAPRAKTPLKFEDDFEMAVEKAADANQPCFLEFQTEWCGPCRVMEELVFTAKEVVTAAEGVICVRVDGDKRKDLVEKYRVMGYPAGVMLDATGEEIGRTGGYQSVKKMSEFFLKNK